MIVVPMMKAVNSQAIWSGAAEKAPCMWGIAVPEVVTVIM